jgi:hypothetical protein
MLKGIGVSSVTIHVPIEFRKPELRSGLGYHGIPAVEMAMPETAVHKYHGSVPRENDVRTARQVSTPEREPKAEPVEQRPDPALGSGIFSPDSAHVPAPALCCESVHGSPRGGATIGATYAFQRYLRNTYQNIMWLSVANMRQRSIGRSDEWFGLDSISKCKFAATTQILAFGLNS